VDSFSLAEVYQLLLVQPRMAFDLQGRDRLIRDY
jgi:hypothetical protein